MDNVTVYTTGSALCVDLGIEEEPGGLTLRSIYDHLPGGANKSVFLLRYEDHLFHGFYDLLCQDVFDFIRDEDSKLRFNYAARGQVCADYRDEEESPQTAINEISVGSNIGWLRRVGLYSGSVEVWRAFSFPDGNGREFQEDYWHDFGEAAKSASWQCFDQMLGMTALFTKGM